MTTQHFLTSSSSPNLTFVITWSCSWSVSFLISTFRYSHHKATSVFRTPSFSRHRSGGAALVNAPFALFRCTLASSSVFDLGLSWLGTFVINCIYSEFVSVVPVKTSICLSKSCGSSWDDEGNIWNGLNLCSGDRLLTCTSLFLFARLKVISSSTMKWNAVVWPINFGYIVSRKTALVSIVLLFFWAWFARLTQDLFFEYKLFVSWCFTKRHFSRRRTFLATRSRHSVLRDVVIRGYPHSVLVGSVESVLRKLDLGLLIWLSFVQAIHFARYLLLQFLYHLAYLEVFIAFDWEAVVELINTLDEFKSSFLG